MKHAREALLAPLSPSGLRGRLEVQFGPGSSKFARDKNLSLAAEPPAYRQAVTKMLRHAYGCPAPTGLLTLIDYAAVLGVSESDIVLFIGRQFRLKMLRRYSKSSS